MQRSWTNGIPAARARAAAASSRRPSCSQIALAPSAIASSTTAGHLRLPAEHVDDLERPRVGERRHGRDAEHLVDGRIDGRDLVAVGDQVHRDAVARPRRVGRQPDHRDARVALQQIAAREREHAVVHPGHPSHGMQCRRRWKETTPVRRIRVSCRTTATPRPASSSAASASATTSRRRNSRSARTPRSRRFRASNATAFPRQSTRSVDCCGRLARSSCSRPGPVGAPSSCAPACSIPRKHAADLGAGHRPFGLAAPAASQPSRRLLRSDDAAAPPAVRPGGRPSRQSELGSSDQGELLPLPLSPRTAAPGSPWRAGRRCLFGRSARRARLGSDPNRAPRACASRSRRRRSRRT